MKEQKPIRLIRKKNPKQCWMPKCKEEGDLYELEINQDCCYSSATVVLCERHQDEVASVGQ